MNKIALAVISLFGGLLFAKEGSAGEVLEDVVERRFPLDPSGTFSLRAIDGTVEIFGTVNQGGLNVFFDWMEEHPISIEAKIEDGNLSARLPTDAAFHLHAVAKEGHVSSDFSPMGTRQRGDDSEINEVIGDGPATRLTFRAGEGNIHVSEVIW